MSKPELTGKTVMIATTNKARAQYLRMALGELGASVVYSKHGECGHDPETSKSDLVYDEIKRTTPMPDALIIDGNLDDKDELNAALEVTAMLKAAIPVIACDSCESFLAIHLLRNSGAKYLDLFEVDPRAFTAAVADAIAQHGKSGKTMSG